MYTKTRPRKSPLAAASCGLLLLTLILGPAAQAEGNLQDGFFQRLKRDVYLNTFWGRQQQNLTVVPPVTDAEQQRRERLTLVDEGYSFTPEAFMAEVRAGNLQAIQRYIFAGMDPNTTLVGDMPALLHAAQVGNTASLQLLRRNGADLNATNLRRENALLIAIKRRHFGLARYLIDQGINFTQQDVDRWTALHHAIFANNGDLMLSLVNKDRSLLTYSTNAGFTPLLTAIWQGNQPMVDALLALGADPTVRDTGGNTALHLAVQRNQVTLVRSLLESGMAPNPTNRQNWTPMDVAIHTNNTDLSQLLLRYGGKPNRPQAPRRGL